MRGRLIGQRWLLYTVGTVLCLLTAIFAFEAKLAWFSPTNSPVAQISASKLQPADTARVIAQALSASSFPQHFPGVAPVFASVAAVAPFSSRGQVSDRTSLQVSSNFSPNLFRRPPPQS